MSKAPAQKRNVPFLSCLTYSYDFAFLRIFPIHDDQDDYTTLSEPNP